jgi:NAD(P) transhydrogenase subunit alpha
VGNFLQLIVKEAKLVLDFDDEILSGACVAHAGKIMNARVAAALETTK